METGSKVAIDSEGNGRGPAHAHCPHVVFRDVLGAEIVARLLDYVAAREKDFTPGVLRNRETGKLRVDTALQDSVYLVDIGAFGAPIEMFARAIAPQALTQLHLNEPNVEPGEFEITAYGHGGHFAAHIDTDERLHRVRILSCVYYFSATPRRFSGGELRLHGFPTLSGKSKVAPPPFVDIVPETDTLVVFPSWLRHEVLPVRVPSGAWADRRFTINCWIHRMSQSAGGG
jgi:Rps23 Pro-64 3,4-dihydroxylase Tpa1-like proline 4-hydroxylase